MKLHAAAFSERGAELALRIARAFGGAAWAPEKYAKNGVLPFGASLGEWTGARFAERGGGAGLRLFLRHRGARRRAAPQGQR